MKIEPGQFEHLTVATGASGRHIYIYENIEALSRAGLGKVDIVPDELQLSNYDIAFRLFRLLRAE